LRAYITLDVHYLDNRRLRALSDGASSAVTVT
jgi:hypothetical protein